MLLVVISTAFGLFISFRGPKLPIPDWLVFALPFAALAIFCFVRMAVRGGVQAAVFLIGACGLLMLRRRIENYALALGRPRETLIMIGFPCAVVAALFEVSAILRKYSKQNQS
jgi:hypothetical protein